MRSNACREVESTASQMRRPKALEPRKRWRAGGWAPQLGRCSTIWNHSDVAHLRQDRAWSRRAYPEIRARGQVPGLAPPYTKAACPALRARRASASGARLTDGNPMSTPNDWTRRIKRQLSTAKNCRSCRHVALHSCPRCKSVMSDILKDGASDPHCSKRCRKLRAPSPRLTKGATSRGVASVNGLPFNDALKLR